MHKNDFFASFHYILPRSVSVQLNLSDIYANYHPSFFTKQKPEHGYIQTRVIGSRNVWDRWRQNFVPDFLFFFSFFTQHSVQRCRVVVFGWILGKSDMNDKIYESFYINKFSFCVLFWHVMKWIQIICVEKWKTRKEKR